MWLLSNQKACLGDGHQTIREGIQEFYGYSVEEYCEKVVKPMQEDAQDYLTETGVLFKCFGVRGGIVNMSVPAKDTTLYNVSSDAQKYHSDLVLLRLLSGHYDLFRSVEVVNQRDQYEDLKIEIP